MFGKRFLAAALLLTATFAYAQKPVTAAVTDIEDNPGDGLEMCRSLFDEYFLSELTTHSKVVTLDTASIIQAISDLKIKRGNKLTPEMIGKLSDKLKVDAICSVFMKKGQDRKTSVTIVLYSRDGKNIGTVKGTMDGVGDTDKVSSSMATEAAQHLRKLKGIHAPRMKYDTTAGSVKSMRKDPVLEKLPSKVTPIK